MFEYETHHIPIQGPLTPLASGCLITAHEEYMNRFSHFKNPIGSAERVLVNKSYPNRNVDLFSLIGPNGYYQNMKCI